MLTLFIYLVLKNVLLHRFTQSWPTGVIILLFVLAFVTKSHHLTVVLYLVSIRLVSSVCLEVDFIGDICLLFELLGQVLDDAFPNSNLVSTGRCFICFLNTAGIVGGVARLNTRL